MANPMFPDVTPTPLPVEPNKGPNASPQTLDDLYRDLYGDMFEDYLFRRYSDEFSRDWARRDPSIFQRWMKLELPKELARQEQEAAQAQYDSPENKQAMAWAEQRNANTQYQWNLDQYNKQMAERNKGINMQGFRNSVQQMLTTPQWQPNETDQRRQWVTTMLGALNQPEDYWERQKLEGELQTLNRPKSWADKVAAAQENVKRAEQIAKIVEARLDDRFDPLLESDPAVIAAKQAPAIARSSLLQLQTGQPITWQPNTSGGEFLPENFGDFSSQGQYVNAGTGQTIDPNAPPVPWHGGDPHADYGSPDVPHDPFESQQAIAAKPLLPEFMRSWEGGKPNFQQWAGTTGVNRRIWAARPEAKNEDYLTNMFNAASNPIRRASWKPARQV